MSGRPQSQSDAESNDSHRSKTEGPPKKKRTLASTISSILATETSEVPILALNRRIEENIENEKLDYAARKAISSEKKQVLERGHILPEPSMMNQEKRHKKIATRGVVQLFNAVNAAQKEQKPESGSKGGMTKQSFLEMLKSQAKKHVASN